MRMTVDRWPAVRSPLSSYPPAAVEIVAAVGKGTIGAGNPLPGRSPLFGAAEETVAAVVLPRRQSMHRPPWRAQVVRQQPLPPLG